MENEQSRESVVLDWLRRDGDGVPPVCRRGQQRALEPGGPHFRSLKTAAADRHSCRGHY